MNVNKREKKMPVPTWDCPELAMLYDQPVDVTTTNVVSEDIWKKFDLDFPPVSLDSTGYRYYYGGIENGVISDPYERSTTLGIYEKLGSSPLLSSTSSSTSSRIEAREIRHHDCMWAGLCISKEHNRTHPAKKREAHSNASKRLAVPAGRSLLINRKQPGSCNTVTTMTSSSCSSSSGGNSNNAMSGLTKNLESDGDSTRPETPQSCESESEEEEEEEDDEDDDDDDEDEGEEEEEEMPRFKHDSISINDKLSEYVRVGGQAGEIHPASSIVSVSEVTGQQFKLPIKLNRVNKQINEHTAKQMMSVKYSRKEEKPKSNKINFYHNNGGGNNNRQDFKRGTNTVYNAQNNNNNNNCTNIVSLGDHCYHLNQTSSSKKLEHLGVQTPSDSEEEIDVVTFDKPSCRPASLPTNPSLADKQHLQKTVTSALKDKAPPRPRGRPPSTSTPRKRTAQSETATKRPAKKPKQKSTMSYQKRSNNRTNNNNNQNNNNNNSNNNNNNNNNVNQDNKNNVTERDEDLCNSRVSSIDRECNVDTNEERNSGCEITRDENIDDRTTIRGSNVSKESNNVNTSTSSRSASSDEEPDTEKRSLHNNMERQRRIELRKAFEDLRVLVPEVEMKEKAPKVVILRQAAIYCDLLTEIGHNTMATVEELKNRQDKLRSKLSQLRRNFRTERTGGAEVRNSNHHNRRARRGSGLQG